MVIKVNRKGFRGPNKECWIGIPGTGIVIPSGPTYSSSSVNGTALSLLMSEALDGSNPPGTYAFTVLVNGTPRTVSSLLISGSTVAITLASGVVFGEVVTIAYTDPTAGDDTAALQSLAGVDTASFSAQSVTNATPDGFPVSSVFATSLYAGNDTSQSINNGIDLSTQGGLLWLKNRTGAHNHILFDTVRGGGNGFQLSSNATSAAGAFTSNSATFNSNGFSLSNGGATLNATANNYVAWNFRKATKFFDIVQYTGTEPRL